jgi:hypothetical protein
MAVSKTKLASGNYINATNSTTKAYAPVGVPNVEGHDFPNVMTSAAVTASTESLVYPNQVLNPGVFTAGTAPEGTASNPTNDRKS